jgi:hypothetical protein
MGRLIDADALKRYLKNPDVNGFMSNHDCEICQEAFCIDCVIKDAIDKAPTVDVAPVVRGFWEKITTSAYIGTDDFGEPIYATRYFYYHDRCGERSAVAREYCPRCGARMELEEE